MSDHYYSEKPQSKQITSTIQCTLNDRPYTFTASTGVFSKKGIDFGSKLLIETFVAPGLSGDLLDLGCGYGPIGIALAKSYPNRTVTMIDINERAVALAKQNAQKNGVHNVSISQSDGFTHVNQHDYAAIITNPPIRTGKQFIYQLFNESINYLQTDGELWIVIQKKQGAPSLIVHLQKKYRSVEVVNRKKGYQIIKAIK